MNVSSELKCSGCRDVFLVRVVGGGHDVGRVVAVLTIWPSAVTRTQELGHSSSGSSVAVDVSIQYPGLAPHAMLGCTRPDGHTWTRG